MRKTLFATFLALILNGLHGYQDSPNSCCDFFEGLEINGEFLWWKGKADNLYISESEAGPNDAGDEVLDEEFAYFSFGYSPGFRVGLSYQPVQWNEVGLYANFTHFRATDNLTVNLVGVEFLDQFVDGILTAVGAGEGGDGDYTGAADFLYNRFDLGLAKYCFNYGCLNVVPKLAFTYVHTRQSVHENTFFIEEDVIVTTEIGVFKAVESYSGYGATIGFDTTYELWVDSGISFFSSVGLSGLWGPFRFTYDADFTVFEDGVEVGTSAGAAHAQTCLGRWMGDIQIGLQYQACLCGCYQIAGRIGWEFLYLADEYYFPSLYNASPMKVNGLTAGIAVGF